MKEYEENDVFERKCPKCKKCRKFTQKHNLDYAIRHNSLCRSCANKESKIRPEVRNNMSKNHADVSGKRNPNYGKHRETYYQSDAWNRYKMDVINITKGQSLSNLENFDKRGRWTYHLDHKISIYEGFVKKVSPEVIGHISNLQMLWWRDNLRKNTKNIKEWKDKLNGRRT